MSLMVCIIAKDKDYSVHELEKEIPYPHNGLFGFENWRYLVWGHKIVKELGCELVYSLKETMVYAFDEEVLQLKNELQKLLDNIETFAEVANNDKSSIEFRIKNALEMIKIAEKNLDKVGVAIL